jgi:N-acetylglucosamine kinase-like BadF-type ATPase
MSKRYFVALDVGGTKAEAVLFLQSGEIVARVVDPAGTPFENGVERVQENCKHTLDKLLAMADGPVEALYAAIASVQYYPDEFERFFKENFNIPYIRIEGDGYCLISGMLGHRDGAGLVCGTGSALYIRKGELQTHLGGGGHLIDSCGSGFTLGRCAIQAALRAHDGSAEKTLLTELLDQQAGAEMWCNLVEIYAGGRAYVASFAPTVFQARQAGDLVARQIFNTCAADLANVVWSARKRLGCAFELVLNGGIFTHFPEYAEAVRALSPTDVTFVYADVPPIYGGAVEALWQVGLTPDAEFRARFMCDYRQQCAPKR